MNVDLIAVRLKSFVTEAAVLIIVGLITVLSSDAFTSILINNFDEIWGGGVGVLIVNGVIKHLMNLKALEKYESNLGAGTETEPPILI